MSRDDLNELGAMSSIATPASPSARVFRLLQHIAKGGQTANLSELARETGISRVTGMRLIAELEDGKMIEQRPGGGHRIGIEFLKLASLALGEENLSQLGQRIISRVSKDLQVSTYLVLLEEGKALYLLRQVPENRLVSNVSIGSLIPAHLTTSGRVLLVRHSDSELRALLGPEPLEAVTDQSPSTYDELNRLIDRVRDMGCAWSHGGLEPGIDSCAAPVLDQSGRPIAAISVAGPSDLFTPEFIIETQGVVISAARDLSVLLRNTLGTDPTEFTPLQ